MADTDKKPFQKESRISWDEFFMQIACTATERVACIYVKVAAVFVDDLHRTIAIGYNGPTRGDIHCDEVGCVKVHGDPISGEIKRCNGIHAEINAIVNSGNTNQLRDSTLYITVFPCYDCMKALNNLGVKRIVYLNDYLRIPEGSDGKPTIAEPEARELAMKRGIICEQFYLDKDSRINDYVNKKVDSKSTENSRIKDEIDDTSKKDKKVLKIKRS